MKLEIGKRNEKSLLVRKKFYIYHVKNSDLPEYLTVVYSRGSLEETKSWLRKLIRREVLSKSDASQYQKEIAPQESLRGKTWRQIECVYQQHKKMITLILNFKFLISNREPREIVLKISTFERDCFYFFLYFPPNIGEKISNGVNGYK